MSTLLNKLVAMITKDIKIAFREKTSFLFPLAFSLISTVLISFSLPTEIVSEHSFQILWIIFLFSGLIIPTEILRHESENGILEGILNSGVEKELIFISKFLICYIIMTAIGFFIIAMFTFFLNFKVSYSSVLIFQLSLIGVTSLSILFSVSYIRGNVGVPIYVILLPLYIPVIIGAQKFLEGDPNAIKLIISFDVLNFSISLLLFDIED